MNLPQEEEIEKQNDVVDKQEGEKLNKMLEKAKKLEHIFK